MIFAKKMAVKMSKNLKSHGDVNYGLGFNTNNANNSVPKPIFNSPRMEDRPQ